MKAHDMTAHTGSFSQASTHDELVSVIICNYNYERFVGEAISSALNIDWPHVEVIVVDDGSTDQSRSIIESFASRGVKGIFQTNRGQARAAEEGYHNSQGKWIMFLDADDLVHPSVIREARVVMRPGWSSIQFQMRLVDESGRFLGSVFPKYRKNTTPEKIRRSLATTATYQTPPTSGNLLSREFLDKIFPLQEGMDIAIDSYFLATAPLLGDVITVSKPLVSYRIHGKNHGAQLTLDVARVALDLRRHIVRTAYGANLGRQFGIEIAPDRWRYGFYNLAMRVASLRLARETHPIQDDTVKNCLRDGLIAFFHPQGLTPLRHVAMLFWLACVAIAPKRIARVLISWRFAPTSRPKLVQRTIQSA
ncbi:glycosyltransferase involved in cell wall biosynthesis [Bradyrhizobium yuanmingense]|uniref:Glycosyltransferase involved in cell wall biosynthesis n=1 Tax=Bradyrhizobium yuanmingense TaxID=108015 RepID=A0ABV4GCS0_9BRAD|nr:glycosyltransferase [Bradyrhizobium yuanmingense]